MITQVTEKEIEEQARYLAHDNQLSDPDVEEVLWFKHDSEVHLVELHRAVPFAGDDKEICPVYFKASPEDGLPAPSCIALIRPEEKGQLDLPHDWNTDWEQAVVIFKRPPGGV